LPEITQKTRIRIALLFRHHICKKNSVNPRALIKLTFLNLIWGFTQIELSALEDITKQKTFFKKANFAAPFLTIMLQQK